MERSSQEFIQCWNQEDFDVSNDEFQIQSSVGNGACITSLSINGNQLLVGYNNDQQSFWIDRNDRYCSNDFMSSSQITIKNGQVDSSDCKPLHQDGVIYYSKLCKYSDIGRIISNFIVAFIQSFYRRLWVSRMSLLS